MATKKELEHQVKTQSEYIKQLESRLTIVERERDHYIDELNDVNDLYTNLFDDYDTIKLTLASIFDCDPDWFESFITKVREEFRRDDER